MCDVRCDRVSMDGWPFGTRYLPPKMSRREPGRVPGSAVARSAARARCAGSLAAGAQAVATTPAGCTGQPQSFGVEGPFANPCRAPDGGRPRALVPRWDSGRPSTPSTAGAQPATARAFRTLRPVLRGWSSSLADKPAAARRTGYSASRSRCSPSRGSWRVESEPPAPKFKLPERHSSSASSLSLLR